jgi:Flp pilus assembly protein TadG
MRWNMNARFRSLCRGQEGQVLPWVALLLIVLLGMAALTIDIGFVLHAQRELQASADAAATAGAQDLSNDLSASTAIKSANLYSGISGGKNAYPDLPNVTMVSGYPAVTCVSSMVALGLACNNAASANALAVQEQVNAPTFFARLFGVTSIKLTASALSAMKGGTPTPANIVVIVDTTGSMGNTDMSCASATGISSPTKLDCAKWGVRNLLLGLYPCPAGAPCGTATGGNVPNAVQEVGILTFPGLVSSADAQYDYTSCGTNMQQAYISPYAGPPTSQPPYFTVVQPSSDYKSSDTSTTLNGASSNLVQAVDWKDGNSCSSSQYGLQNPAGEGTYYAGIITEAQSDLSALTGPRARMQDVIILLSDGAANSTWNSSGPPTSQFTKSTPSSYGQNECQQAVSAAATAAGTANAAGLKTWVYAVAYGASTSQSNSCTTDSSTYSGCYTMQNIASDASKFYSDDANGCVSAAHPTTTTLGGIFQQIPYDFLTTRMLPFSLYTPPS